MADPMESLNIMENDAMPSFNPEDINVEEAMASAANSDEVMDPSEFWAAFASGVSAQLA
jgi:hypothetical protein